MKFLRKSLLITLIAVLSLGAALFAAACGGSVKLSFETNGAPAIESYEVSGGEAILPAPEWDNHYFEGWYTEADFSGQSYRGKITAPQKNTTYYAKWSDAYLLTLDLGGGALVPSSLWLKEGANISDAVRELVPVKEGVKFGAWFYGGTELSDALVMPARGLTLEARYKTEYRIEIELENVAGNAYVRSDENTVFGSDYVGKTLTLDAPSIAHFTADATHAGTVSSNTLTAGGENVFRFYYTRNFYRVEYAANNPAGTVVSGNISNQTVRYGGKVVAAGNDFALSGYRFAGWGTTAAGDVVYEAGEAITVTGNARLYAVWDRGYTDRYGSEDLIYFPRLEPGRAILSRGGYEFDGKREGDSFLFVTPGGTELRGKVFGGAFSYERTELKGKYVYYIFSIDPDIGEQYLPSVTLEIDEYMNAVYMNGIENHTCSGKVEFDADYGDYLFTSADESFHVLFAKSEGEYEYLFSVGSMEAGIYMDFWIVDEETGQGVSYGEILFLDGYGSAVLYEVASLGYIELYGYYYVENAYDAAGIIIYKIVCLIYDAYGLIGAEGEWVEACMYTMPTEDDYGAYVFADGYRGTYSNGEDTLKLDGYGFFEDSAVYIAGGREYRGIYDIKSDFMTGTLVTFTTTEGEIFRFLLDYRSFTVYTEIKGEYAEYYYLNDGLDFPLLVLYAEKYEGGYKAELYMTEDNGVSVRIAARGYYTAEELGDGYILYSFFRLETFNGYENYLPAYLKFFTTSVISSDNLKSYEVYHVLQYDDELRYDTVEIEGGGMIWASNRAALDGVGSLYFSPNGEVIEGSFTFTASGYFEVSYGTFLYGSATGNIALNFTLTERDEGGYYAVRTMSTETELNYYLYKDGTARYVVDLVIDGNGRAVYNDDYGYGNWQTASYMQVELTVFGAPVYSLTVGGQEKFRFLVYVVYDYYGNGFPIYFIYDPALDGTYTSADGSLVLDGFCMASYTLGGTTIYGTYSVDQAGKVVYFTSEQGSCYFELSGKTFYALDAGYGTYYLVNANYEFINNYMIVLDGRGNLTLRVGDTTVRSGWYEITDPYIVECILYADLGSGYGEGAYLAQLIYFESSGLYGCIVYDAETYGVYIDDDWNVLRLDGYGGGSLHTADGILSGEGMYAVIDYDFGFLVFGFEYSSENIFLLIDNENKSFRMVDYSDFGMLYLASDLDYIFFGVDGVINVGLNEGYYLPVGNGVRAYLYDYNTDSFRKREMNFPAGDGYEYGGKRYALWDGARLLMEGEIALLDADGNPLPNRAAIHATIDFTPVYGSNINLRATFTIEGENYAGFVLNFYTNGELNPRITYANEDNTSGISYPISFSYDPKGASSFTVRAGYTETVMQDYREHYRDEEGAHLGGKLIKVSIGFGPITLEGPYFSGMFLYLYDEASGFTEPICFEGISGDELTIIGYRDGFGYGYEAVFTFKGVNYAIDYYEYYNYYTLYSLYTYEDIRSGDYTVRVKYLAYTNTENTPGYGRMEEAVGRAYGVTLFRENGAVVTFDTGITLNRDAVWLVEYVDGGAGPAYLVNFTFGKDGRVTAADVEEYRFVQAGSATSYYFNLMVDEEGNIVHVVAAAYYDNVYHSVYWVDGTHDLEYHADTDTWTFYGCAGGAETRFILKFTREDVGGKTRYTVSVTVE